MTTNRTSTARLVLIGLSCWAVGLVAFILLTSCSPPQRGQYATQPPARYQGDVTVIVRFEDPTQAALDCRNAAHESGVTPEFCTLPGGTMIVPNACRWPNDSDYRQGFCHEIAHAPPNNWPADHPR